MILSSGNFGSLGGADLYLSKVNSIGAWTLPQNLGQAINSKYTEFAAGISPDNKYLYYTSERPGIVPDTVSGRPPGDIYRTILQLD